MTRVVIDTNLIISGLLWRGRPAELYRAAATMRFEWLISPALLDELRRVLAYPKFGPRLAEQQLNPELLLADIEEIAELIETATDIPDSAIRDPNDRIVLACAVGGKADYIVSGDQDLLVLNRFRDIPILTAAAFLAILDSPSAPMKGNTD